MDAEEKSLEEQEKLYRKVWYDFAISLGLKYAQMQMAIFMEPTFETKLFFHALGVKIERS